MADDTENAAMQLNAAKRLLVAMAVQVGWRTGVTVHPSEVTSQAQLLPDTPLCSAAVDLLESEGAIEPDEESTRLASVVVGNAYSYYKITTPGLDMARRWQDEA